MLERLRQYGHTFETIESDDISKNEQRRLYTTRETQALFIGNARRYRVRNVFGSNRQGEGYLFGKQVPALVVFEESIEGAMFPSAVRAAAEKLNRMPFACDIYPHDSPHKGQVLIHQLIRSLLSQSDA